LSKFIIIAWRNIWKNKRRTIITVSAIAFSVAIIIYSISMADGSHDAMIKRAMEIFSGYIQIHEEGFQEDPKISKSFKLTPQITKAIDSTPKITAYSPRLQSGALVATEKNSLGGMVVGINPELESKVTIVQDRVIKGKSLIGSKMRECLIGEKMAKNLKVNVGDNLVTLVQGFDGSMGAIKFSIRGIFKTGSDEMDRSLVFINLQDAGELLAAPDRVNSIAITTDSPKDVPEVVSRLKENLYGIKDENNHIKFELLGWKKLMPDLVQFVILDSVGNYLFLGVLAIVVIFGILSAVFASVLERTHEFGIMLAIGTKPGQLIMMVMLEALLLTIVGVGIGLVIGLALSFYYISHPINLPQSWESISSEYGMDNKLYFAVYPLRLSIAIGAMVFLSLLFSYLPAWRVSRLKPDKAIRSIYR